MANELSLPGGLVCPGAATFRGAVNVGTAANLSPAGMQHEHREPYAQPNTTATTETKVVATIRGATGTLKGFVAGAIVAPLTTATVTLDLKKSTGGGAFASVLSAPITIDNANVDRVVEAATIAGATLTAGDVLEIVVTATASGGTLPTGVFAEVRWVEDYSG
jgi:hypothetical protein